MLETTNMFKQLNRKLAFAIVLSALFIIQIMTTLGALLHQPWFFWIGVCLPLSLLFIYTFVKNDGLFKRLFIYGIIFGTIELWSDAYYILLGAIEYKHFGFFRLLQSPDYMPLAWATYCIIFGFLGVMLDSWKRNLWLLFVCALFLGVVIPPYNESMAYYANAWEYLGSPAWQHTPYWIWILFPIIIVGMVLPVVLLVRRKSESYLEWIGGASLGAIWLLITSQICYNLFG